MPQPPPERLAILDPPGVADLVALDPILGIAVQAGMAARFTMAAAALTPISFFLGWQFPAGIAELSRVDESLIPIAWASNGVASVVAAPLAVLLAMMVGFRLVAVIAGACYGVVAVMARITRGGYSPSLTRYV